MKLAGLDPQVSFLSLVCIGALAAGQAGHMGGQRTPAVQAQPPLGTTPPSTAAVQVPRPAALPGGSVTAVVVRSWGSGGATGWAELNAEWPMYGATPIAIDTTTLGGVSSFTYADLAATDADVVILSDPAGGVIQYTDEEIDAIRQYVEEGHDILGTFLTFRHRGVDNTGLLALFGLREDVDYADTGHHSITNQFEILRPGALLRGLPAAGWTSSGYPKSQRMEDFPLWTSVDHPEAVPVAECDGGEAMISIHRNPVYNAVYVSNMPEYFGSALDKQLLYNAITLPDGVEPLATTFSSAPTAR